MAVGGSGNCLLVAVNEEGYCYPTLIASRGTDLLPGEFFACFLTR